MSVRKKILDAAYELFCERGYEKTTVQAIVDYSGSSKGGLYHHFKTKEEIVEAVTLEFIKDLETRYKLFLSDRSKSVFELINNVVKQVNDYKISMVNQWPGIAKMLSFDGNTRIIQSMAMQFEKVTSEAYYTLILRGIDEGLFKVKYPLQLAKLFAREILQIYSKMTQILTTNDNDLYQEFLLTLDFIQEVINSNLGLNEHKILVKKEALSYLEEVKKKYGA